MEAEEAKKRGLEPMAKIVSIGFAWVDPTVMGWWPVPASEKALEYAGLTADNIDFWEINEVKNNISKIFYPSRYIASYKLDFDFDYIH